jgi:superfamily II DNA or RNA helicase
LAKAIICDEFHHVIAAGYTKIFGHFPNSCLVGFTAMPLRMDT